MITRRISSFLGQNQRSEGLVVKGDLRNLDIFVSFFTGYYHRGVLVMKPRRIAVHYLRTEVDLEDLD